MTVAENLQLGGFPTKAGFMDWPKLRKRRHALLHGDWSGYRCGYASAQLTTGQEQMVQIAGALGVNARIIIFDEPNKLAVD